MRKFAIRVARIERAKSGVRGEDIRLTFRFERGPIGFDLPLFIKSGEFDDTEIVQVARSRLSEIFLQLAAQSEDWRLSDDELRQLAKMSSRPAARGR